MTDRIREQITRGRDLRDAYSTDFFGPVEGDPIKKTGEYASKENRSLITRNSAAMGRFLYELHIGPMADSLEALLEVKDAAKRRLTAGDQPAYTIELENAIAKVEEL